jgi:hypothetical protein
MSALSAQQNARSEEEERDNAMQQLHLRRAAALGFPTEGVEAQQQDKEIDDKYGRQNYLASLLPILMQKKQQAPNAF